MRSCVIPVSARPLLAGLLVLQLALPVTLAAQMQQEPAMQVPTMQPAPKAATFEPGPRLSGDDKLLQVLNRFTYGPRPGDLERLRSMGLNAWFQQQLYPASIDDSALDKRLADYPAMELPLNRLMEMYPNNQMIRQAMNGRAGAPGGAAEHAIYADQMERYKQKKKNGKDASSGDADAVALPKPAAEILALPPDQRFKELCKLNIPQLREFRRSLAPAERDRITDGMTPAQTEALAAFEGPARVVEAEDIQVKLLRDIYSERQLNEIMVDFWLNHFNVYMRKSQEAPYYIAAYERSAIRPYALGSFENLLRATATSPAMLNYLDNSSSIGPRSDYARGIRPRFEQQKQDSGLNENYGRELMELHTVGVNGGYTQHDVTEVAKVFTGWTVGKPQGQDVDAQAQYDPTKHEPGDKMVLGHKIKFDGMGEGLAVLHMLATSPQTARFISTKLAVRFVSDTPPAAMIDNMAATFTRTEGNIRAVLLAMINSPEFFTSGAYRVKVKTPQEYVVSAVRAAGSNVQSTAAMADMIAQLGMPLYGHQTPDGYSMKSDAWNNTAALVSRMNFALALATNRVAGVTTDFNALLGGDAGNLTPEEKDTALENAILHVAVSPRTQQLIFAQTSGEESEQAASLRQVRAVNGRGDALAARGLVKRPGNPAAMDTQAAVASGLIFGSPEFQRR
ncbi:MAG TPA: DUF1800 domain-containing protein [Acidobacteriaceae bacterium]|nr:DUF1800 domain-containing protein [Acidobacteriaceae bacterium]